MVEILNWVKLYPWPFILLLSYVGVWAVAFILANYLNPWDDDPEFAAYYGWVVALGLHSFLTLYGLWIGGYEFRVSGVGWWWHFSFGAMIFINLVMMWKLSTTITSRKLKEGAL